MKDCAAIAIQNLDVATRLNAELIIRRIHYIRPIEEAAVQEASHGLPNGQLWEHSPSWFDCQENEDSSNMII